MLQNRMALDLLLAAQGGTCKVIGAECCSYVSDATSDMMDMVHDTAEGVKHLHEAGGYNLGDFTGMFGSWGAELVRFLTIVIVAVLFIGVLITCLVTAIKLVCKKVINVQATQRVVNNTGITSPQVSEDPGLDWIPLGLFDDDDDLRFVENEL